MEIAIIVPTLRKGGAERVASVLSQGLSKWFDITLIVFDARDIAYQYDGRLIDLGHYDIEDRGFFKRLKNTLLLTWKLRRLKRSSNIPVFFSLLELANIPNVLSGPGSALLSVHQMRLKATNRNLQRRVADRMVSLLYNRARGTVAVSEGVRQSLIHDFGLAPDKVMTVYNSVDIDRIRVAAEEEMEPEHQDIFRHPVFITMGRLFDQKGHWHLIRAFSEFHERKPETRLVILGEGELREPLEQLTDGLGLSSHVHFLGFQTNPFRYLSRAFAYVFPSLWEGHPMALIEAMACGLPVISSDCESGPREVLAPDTAIGSRAAEIEMAQYGILVPPCSGRFMTASDAITGEEQTLARAMETLLTTEGLSEKYAALSIERAGDFATGQIMGQWKALIEQLAENSTEH